LSVYTSSSGGFIPLAPGIGSEALVVPRSDGFQASVAVAQSGLQVVQHRARSVGQLPAEVAVNVRIHRSHRQAAPRGADSSPAGTTRAGGAAGE